MAAAGAEVAAGAEAAEVAGVAEAAGDSVAEAATEAAVCHGELAASARPDHSPTLTLSALAGFDKVDPANACFVATPSTARVG